MRAVASSLTNADREKIGGTTAAASDRGGPRARAYTTDIVLPEFEQFPQPPGKNPYRVKGNAYRGHMDYVEQHVPGGIEAMRAGFEDPLLKEFFGQTFLAASFYDLYPLVAAGWVCAKLCGM